MNPTTSTPIPHLYLYQFFSRKDELVNARHYYRGQENITYVPVVDSNSEQHPALLSELDDDRYNPISYAFKNNFGQRKTELLRQLQQEKKEGWIFFLDGDEYLTLDSLSHLSNSLPTHIDFSSPFCIGMPRNNTIKGVGPKDLEVLKSLKETGGGNEVYEGSAVLPKEMRRHYLQRWMYPDIQPRLMSIALTDEVIGVTHEMPVAKRGEDHGMTVDFFPVIQHRKSVAEQERMDRYHRDLLNKEREEKEV